MRTIRTQTLGAFLALCLSLITLHGHANESVDPQRLLAAKALVSSPGFADVMVLAGHQVFSEIASKQPDRTDEMAWKTKQVTVQEAVQRLAPIYAQFLSADQANELRKFFVSPVGQKFWGASGKASAEGKPHTAPQLNASEHRQVLAFTMSSAAWRTFNQAQPVIRQKLNDLSRQWGQELSDRHLADFRQQIADAVTGSDNVAAAPSEADVFKSPEQLLVAAVKNFSVRNRMGMAQYQDRIKKLELVTVLTPANLTSRDGITQGRAKLDLFELELNQRLREYNATSDELLNTLKRIAEYSPLGAGFLAGAEKTMANRFERALRAEENQRTVIALSRQMLTFVEQRFGRIKNEGNQLIFDEDQDLATYRDLLQRIRREGEIETQIELEEQQAHQAALSQLRAEPRPSNPKP